MRRVARHRALAIVVLLVGVAGCGGGRATDARTAATDRSGPSSAQAPLQPLPASVATACRALARSRTVRVLCPTRLPTGRWVVYHRTLRNGSCAYLLDLNTRPFGQNVPFHSLAGGRCSPWPLTTARGHWPADPRLANDLGLVGAKPLQPGQARSTIPTAVPPRVLRRIRVGTHLGLLLQGATYPNGGVHGGHVAVIWNQGDSGYVLSLHFTEQPHAPTSGHQQIVVDAADAMSVSSARSGGLLPAARPDRSRARRRRRRHQHQS